jgi:signal transduction histidine kinase
MELVSVAKEGAVLADRLQDERAAATAVLIGGSPFEQQAQYRLVAEATDDAVADYRRARGELRSAPTGADVLLARIDDQIGRMPSVRDEVREGPTVALSAVTFAYRITIADLVSLRESVAQAEGGSAELLGEIRAAGALSRATEYSARLQIEVLQAIATGGATTPADQQAIMGIGAGYREAMTSFDELAPAQWQDWLDHALTGPNVQAAQGFEDQVARAPVGTSVPLDTTRWVTATREQIALLHQVERQVDESIRADVDQVYGDKLAWVIAEAAVAFVALMLAVVLAIGQSRSMIRRLRALAGAARITAFVSLPQTVKKLRAIGPETIDPDAFASQAEAPVPDTGSDEIADVSQAFLAVHRQAIITAADLANMRAGLSQILLHLARRNQRLVGGLIRELDGAERGEDDPDRLAALFRLDQLATRMGRYNDNLLIMGGHTASRVDAANVALDTVLRGAQSKIEQYQRIRNTVMQTPMIVRGLAVHDLTNLLAELLDNATHFSQPESFVDVTAGILDGRVVIQVRDWGVGIPARRLEQFNHILAAPPAIDVSAVRSMGLTVVAHIAARHQVQVRLTPGSSGGTVAHVIVPRDICEVPGYEPPLPDPEASRPSPFRTYWRHAAQPDPPIYRGVGANFSWFQPGGAAVGAARTRRGVADAGWAAAALAASYATAPEGGRITHSGLPRRPPMANLVPGAVPDGIEGVGAADYRDPAVVAASVAAFAQGNAMSRARNANGARSPSARHKLSAQRGAGVTAPPTQQEHR